MLITYDIQIEYPLVCVECMLQLKQSPNRTVISTYGKWGGDQRSAKILFKFKDLNGNTHTIINNNQTANNNYIFGNFTIQYCCGCRSVSTINTHTTNTHTHLFYNRLAANV